ncbi:hypothetical protein ACFSJU_06800 [Paradesertivirga mongoliensis]|uniref:Outer membrane protein beta-barrel domain-containing protein n=1 Tax=Paradesertivirga mongoliensis TaxID=2100740 RepID=A0ABW4ZJL0_9SPHI|nr:hypothetical protein [Pedobacter mongoliensis]
MKSFLLPLVACFVAFSSYAQTSSESDDALKAAQKKWVLELNVNPFKSDLNLANALNQIKVRTFLSDRTALRLGFHANRLSSDVESGNPYGTNPMIYRDEKSSTTLGFNIGFEKHLGGTRRLSPYFGVDLAVSNKSSKQELTNGSVKTTIKNAWTTYSTTSMWVPNYNGTGGQYVTQPIYRTEEIAYLKYGLNIVSGFDYYVSKHFFVGAELSLGFSQTNHKNVKFSQSGSTSGSSTDNSDQKNNSFQFGTSNYNGIRLGYVL